MGNARKQWANPGKIMGTYCKIEETNSVNVPTINGSLSVYIMFISYSWQNHVTKYGGCSNAKILKWPQSLWDMWPTKADFGGFTVFVLAFKVWDFTKCLERSVWLSWAFNLDIFHGQSWITCKKNDSSLVSR